MEPALLLPIISAFAGSVAFVRIIGAAVRIDNETVLPLGFVITAVGAALAFVWWYANDRAKQRESAQRSERRSRRAFALAKLACEKDPHIDHRHGKVREIIAAEMSDAQNERAKGGETEPDTDYIDSDDF